MATLTGSRLSLVTKSVHTGVMAVGGNLTTAVTAAANTIILMNKLPTQATLVDFWVNIYTKKASAQAIELGTSATPSGIMQVTTLTSTYSTSISPVILVSNHIIRAPGGNKDATVAAHLMPVHISLSDDKQPSDVWVRAKLTEEISASAVFSWALFYTMDLPGHTTIR